MCKLMNDLINFSEACSGEPLEVPCSVYVYPDKMAACSDLGARKTGTCTFLLNFFIVWESISLRLPRTFEIF